MFCQYIARFEKNTFCFYPVIKADLPSRTVLLPDPHTAFVHIQQSIPDPGFLQYIVQWNYRLNTPDTYFALQWIGKGDKSAQSKQTCHSVFLQDQNKRNVQMEIYQSSNLIIHF